MGKISRSYTNENAAVKNLQVLVSPNKYSPKKGHVLFFHSLGTKSHINVARALVAGLLESGHSVTTGFYTQTHIKHANYTEILIKDE